MKSFIFISILILLHFNCSTEPESELALIIQDGYFGNVGNSEFSYSIEFKYSVNGEICNVGGYGISWGEGKDGFVDWYIMQKLEPNRIYSITDTFNLDAEIRSNPIVSMQGYLEGVTKEDSRLHVEYKLKSK
jgi:hypothetical protein